MHRSSLAIAGCLTGAILLAAGVPAPALAGTAPAAVAQVGGYPYLMTPSAGMTHAVDALPPRQNGAAWEFVLPAKSSPLNPRRSEVWWQVNGRHVQYREGDTVRYQADIVAGLGRAAMNNDNYHVLYQLIGRTDGQWLGPVFNLNVLDGELSLTGGNGHAEHRTGPSRFWQKTLAPWQDGRTYRVQIESRLGVGTAGWISVWVNGVQVVNRMVPTTRSGLVVGTWYPGSGEVYSRSGLYRGGSEAPPTYWQAARHSNVRVG